MAALSRLDIPASGLTAEDMVVVEFAVEYTE